MIFICLIIGICQVIPQQDWRWRLIWKGSCCCCWFWVAWGAKSLFQSQRLTSESCYCGRTRAIGRTIKILPIFQDSPWPFISLQPKTHGGNARLSSEMKFYIDGSHKSDTLQVWMGTKLSHFYKHVFRRNEWNSVCVLLPRRKFIEKVSVSGIILS